MTSIGEELRKKYRNTKIIKKIVRAIYGGYSALLQKKKRKQKHWLGVRIIKLNEIQENIAQCILQGKPYAVARPGYVEQDTLYNWTKKKLDDSNIFTLDNNAGAFGLDKKTIIDFCKLYDDSLDDLDVLGVWLRDNEYAYKKHLNNVELVRVESIFPWSNFENPWTKALKGKKVLVVHPFVDTIKKQYDNYRAKIWGKYSENILPEFELITLKAIQTQGGERDKRFATWFDALDYMKENIHVIDFDVALITCGAYAVPLCAEVKKMGKVAINMGGMMQWMFGIKGKRWDENNCNGFANEYWTRASGDEIIAHSEKIEGGCYW